ncbi:Pex11 [Symbiodinium necroappetens]|uniref:Pex11 protein n=1 Tax=Symbiodinium necroappetens TaxID=1628268 RepID=A0A813BSK3_9DINO|nr:Pex11 [Symbiodinium sp. CCMP2456]CAE7915471.1 Pex11 [Symbiodinium necroappetens]
MAVSKVFFSTPPLLGHNEAYLPPIKGMGHVAQLLAGPALMILVLGLQNLKRQLTNTHKSELYEHIWKFISKAEARDKTGRIVQYFCRFLQGFLGHMSEGFWLQAWKPVIAEVQTTLAWARRTHRWGKELPHIPALGKAIESGDILEAAQRAVLITFLIQDHIYWLLKVGILKFQNYTAIQWHRRNLRFITLSHVLNFSLCVRQVMNIRKKQQAMKPEDKDAIKQADKKVYDEMRMMVRYTLTFIQMLHVSQVKKMDDWYIGLMGVASSYIDASKQW